MSLRLREFSAAAPGPHLLITGAVHGDEFEPIAAIRRLVDLFDAGADEHRLQRGRLTLVPIVNEGAFLRGQRTAADGLDLARVCPGDPHGSETQRTAAALSELIRTATAYVDLHSGGTTFAVSPLAGYVLHPDSGILETQRRMARAFNLPIVWGTSPNLDGRSLSVARDAGIPAIYCEYLGSARCDAEGVQAYVDGCLNVLAELGMVFRQQPFSRVRHVVEDPRDNSGHLQVCNPSPTDGYFEPHVELGDAVLAGTLLGVVTDVAGIQRHELRTPASGIVILLRTFPRVLRGESVAVVMEDVTPRRPLDLRSQILQEIDRLGTGIPEHSYEVRAPEE